MRRTIAVIVSALMATTMALSAAGCGGTTEEVSTTTMPTIPKATNATTAPTEPSTVSRGGSTGSTVPSGASSATGATSPSGAAQSTTAPQGGNEMVTEAAYNYFSVSEDVGATIQYNGTDTTPDGTLFYYVTVYFAGEAFPLYVSEDATITLEPEAYLYTYNMAAQIDAPAATEAAGGDQTYNSQAYAESSAADDYNVVEPYYGE